MKETVVYPSSIVPEGSALEPLRDAKIILSSLQIEVLHIISFVIILSMIMGTSWYALYLVRKSAQKKAPAAAKNNAAVDGELAAL